MQFRLLQIKYTLSRRTLGVILHCPKNTKVVGLGKIGLRTNTSNDFGPQLLATAAMMKTGCPFETRVECTKRTMAAGVCCERRKNSGIGARVLGWAHNMPSCTWGSCALHNGVERMPRTTNTDSDLA
jgi:hypothetical protein